jgi:hypothetical protein
MSDVESILLDCQLPSRSTPARRLRCLERLNSCYRFPIYSAYYRASAKLYFLKDDADAQIILRTDASDYGYGVYLCQIVGEREYPVLFMSKSFHGAELNWKTQDRMRGDI